MHDARMSLPRNRSSLPSYCRSELLGRQRLVSTSHREKGASLELTPGKRRCEPRRRTLRGESTHRQAAQVMTPKGRERAGRKQKTSETIGGTSRPSGRANRSTADGAPRARPGLSCWSRTIGRRRASRASRCRSATEASLPETPATPPDARTEASPPARMYR